MSDVEDVEYDEVVADHGDEVEPNNDDDNDGDYYATGERRPGPDPHPIPVSVPLSLDQQILENARRLAVENPTKTVLLYNAAIRVLRTSEIIGIERNNPPDSNMRELWPLPADMLIVMFEQLRPLAMHADKRVAGASMSPVDRQVDNVVTSAANLATALTRAAIQATRPRSSHKTTRTQTQLTADVRMYWSRFDACLVCKVSPGIPCLDLRDKSGQTRIRNAHPERPLTRDADAPLNRGGRTL